MRCFVKPKIIEIFQEFERPKNYAPEIAKIEDFLVLRTQLILGLYLVATAVLGCQGP